MQSDAGVATVPEHDGGAHVVAADRFVHTPFSVAPLTTEHARHAPEHGESQQNPSAQLLLRQSALAMQVDPCGFGAGATHALDEQEYPAAQSAGPLHELLHALAPQAYGAQLAVPLETQAPAPSQ